jgi:hypothetical protein
MAQIGKTNRGKAKGERQSRTLRHVDDRGKMGVPAAGLKVRPGVMDAETLSHLQRIWTQGKADGGVPVVFRRIGKGRPLAVRMPYHVDNRPWLAACGRRNPQWNSDEDYWEVPISWFNKLVHRYLDRFKMVYIIQPYREQEKCSRSCMDASGHECNCSCMGANHGQGFSGGWLEISDAFATRWGEETYACRLMRSRT